jgi:2,4-dienoyl-CoA reductase (NADPH2)
METWNIKAHAKAIGQSTDLVPMAVRPSDDPDDPGDSGDRAASNTAVVLTLQHHPTGTDHERICDWVVCSVHQQPEDELWRALADQPFELHRVGDCVAPRRAHAAVIEGHRVAVSL